MGDKESMYVCLCVRVYFFLCVDMYCSSPNAPCCVWMRMSDKESMYVCVCAYVCVCVCAFLFFCVCRQLVYQLEQTVMCMDEDG